MQHDDENTGNTYATDSKTRRKCDIDFGQVAMLDKFFEQLRPNTRRRYQSVLKDFTLFMGGDLSVITEQDVFAYWDSIRERNYSGATLRNQIEALRSMFEYLKNRGHIAINPFEQAALKLPHRDWNRKRKAECVPFDLVLPLCNAPNRHSKEGIRDRAYLALLFGGALRISESHELKVGDVRALSLPDEAVVIYVTLAMTKAGLPQEQALPHWAAERVLRLVEQRHSEGAGPDSPLITEYRQSRTVPTEVPPELCTLRRRFYAYRNELGLSKTITPHSARVTAISRLVDRRIPIREIQSFARHASVTTTERYIRLEEKLEKCASSKVVFC